MRSAKLDPRSDNRITFVQVSDTNKCHSAMRKIDNFARS